MPPKKKAKHGRSNEGTVYYLNAPIGPGPVVDEVSTVPQFPYNALAQQYNSGNNNNNNNNENNNDSNNNNTSNKNQHVIYPPYQNYYQSKTYATQPEPSQISTQLSSPQLLNKKQPLTNTSVVEPKFQYSDRDNLQMILKASQHLGDVDLDMDMGVYYLNTMKKKNAAKQEGKQDEKRDKDHKQLQAVSYKDYIYKVAIHRDIPPEFFSIKSLESDVRDVRDVRDGSDDHQTPNNKEDIIKISGVENARKPKLDVKYVDGDIIFSNGNNREKRRVELFENYSELFKFKELNRQELYASQLSVLDSKIKKLTIPIIQGETSSYKYLNPEFYEIETDIIEERDYNLAKAKNWRNFKRLQNEKIYYLESLKTYQEAYKEVDSKLEKLKFFFQRQKTLLSNLDRDFAEISSPRAEKFFNGFIASNILSESIKSNGSNVSNGSNGSPLKREIEGEGEIEGEREIEREREISPDLQSDRPSDSNISPETSDANSSSTQLQPRRKIKNVGAKARQSSPSTPSLNNTIMLSILEGYAPLLTQREFEIATGEELESRYIFTAPQSRTETATPQESETDIQGNTTPLKSFPAGVATPLPKKQKRGVGRPSRESRINNASGTDQRTDTPVSNAREPNANTLNKIMKHYVSPDALNNEDVEADLALFNTLKK